MRALLLITFVAACASVPEPTEIVPGVFRVEMSRERFGTIAAVIVDGTQLVVAARKADPSQRPNRPPDDQAVAHPETNSLFVWWFGGVCRFGPSVALTGNADRLTLTVRPEDGGTLPPNVGCDLVGMAYGVELSLAEPVEQSALVLNVVR